MSPTDRKRLRARPEALERVQAARDAANVAATAAATPKLALPASVLAFEDHLLALWREEGKLVKRVPMPAKPPLAVRMIWIRQIDSDDEIEAANMADIMSTTVQKQSRVTMNRIESREARRLSICAIWRTAAEAPEEVSHAAPMVEINGWPSQFWATLEQHYLDLNGIPWEELRNSIAGSAILGAPPPPSLEAPAVAR